MLTHLMLLLPHLEAVRVSTGSSAQVELFLISCEVQIML